MRAPSRRIRRVSVMWRLSYKDNESLDDDSRRSRSARGRTEEDQARRERSDDDRVSALSHDPVDDADRETTEDSRHAPHADIGHVDAVDRVDVLVADVVELEVAVEAREPPAETVQHLRERRMDVEVVLAQDVIRGELGDAHAVARR